MKTRLTVALLACLLGTSQIRADEPTGRRRAPSPPDLAAVPTDALGFVHIRVADIWKSDALKEFRDTVLKAGTKALDGFDARFIPAPSSIDRLTVAVIPQDEDLRREPHVLAFLGVTKPIDKDLFLKSAMPKAVEKKAKNGSFYRDENQKVAVAFLTNQVLVIGDEEGLQSYLDRNFKSNGPLHAALQQANGKRHITAAGNLGLIPAKALEEIPPEVRPLALAQLAVISLDLAENASIDVSLQYRDEKAAIAADDTIGILAKKGRVEIQKGREEMLKKVLGDGKVAPIAELPETALALIALGSFERLDEILAAPPIKRSGSTLHASVKLPSGSGLIGMSAMGAGLLLPAVQKVREAAARTKSMNNLKQIGIAMHNHQDGAGSLPNAAICDKKGKPLLSWRVSLLPYIEQRNLYEQFKLDEPWDSEHNKKLIKYLPPIYVSPNAPMGEPGMTHYRIVTGKDAVFDLNNNLRIENIIDGASNTILVFEAADPVIWTKPEEFVYDPKKPLPKVANFGGRGFAAVFGDGAARIIPATYEEKMIRRFFQSNDGMTVTFP
ncbi:MAG: DUF1559 domain-containing protein [Planctomycetes bacterium]|nr:DUF1559 domain-containing protein [Planctomycetota bacterium]